MRLAMPQSVTMNFRGPRSLYKSSFIFTLDDKSSLADTTNCRGGQSSGVEDLNSRRHDETRTIPTKMTRFREVKNFLLFVWDFIIVYVFGIFYLPLEFLGKHNKSTGVNKRNGEVAIVTGGSRGIGLEVAKQMLAQGMHVILASSNTIHGSNLLQELQDEYPNGKVEYRRLDLSSLESVKSFAKEFLERNLPLHVLVNNAGIMFGPYMVTRDGFESQLQINYLGHFFLTYLLLPRLKECGSENRRSRVVNVSSCCHFAGHIKIDDLHSREYYSAHGSYAQSKLAQVTSTILMQELFQREGANVTVNSVHPGIVNTNLYQYTWFDLAPLIARWFFKTPEQGADGVVHVALSNHLEGIGGKYFENCRATCPNSKALDKGLQIRLWEETCRMLQIKDLQSCN